jgi:hypothetical protein
MPQRNDTGMLAREGTNRFPLLLLETGRLNGLGLHEVSSSGSWLLPQRDTPQAANP